MVLPPATPDCCVIEGDEEKMKISNGLVSVVVESGKPWYGGIVTYYRKERQILRTKFKGDYMNRNMHVGEKQYAAMLFESTGRRLNRYADSRNGSLRAENRK